VTVRRVAGAKRPARTASIGVAAALSLVALFRPRESRAEPGTDEPHSELSASALVGAGITIGGPNLHADGAGVRVGYTFETPLYAGALGLFHLGTSDDGEPSARHHAQDVGVELGYALRLKPIVLRPTLRAGASWITTARDVDGEFVSPHVGFGVTTLVPIGRAHVGFDADARLYTRLVDNGDNAYSNLCIGAYGVVGVQF
jgi:hypothetical protein